MLVPVAGVPSASPAEAVARPRRVYPENVVLVAALSALGIFALWHLTDRP